ncbi:MAG: GGDEF domain-containing protein, partial [bacterium]|nr:GGDEF domain-containing protein [bacterium]
ASILREQVRESDLAARYGGEEFVVLLPGASKERAFEVAERVRRTIERHEFPFGSEQPGGTLSVSGGVATFRVDASEPDALVEAADQALYLAKGSGKNRVLCVGQNCREYRRVEVRVSGRVQPLADVECPLCQ